MVHLQVVLYNATPNIPSSSSARKLRSCSYGKYIALQYYQASRKAVRVDGLLADEYLH